MDGGRVLRALLAMRRGHVEATNIAARVGQALAFCLGFLGLLGNPILLFIAIFVYIAASAEAHATSLIDVSRRLGVRDAMITQFETLGPQATVADAVERLLRTTQHEFPVVDGSGRLRGVLTRDAIIAALSRTGPSTPVLDVMQADVPVVPIQGRLETAMRHLQEGDRPVVAVTDGSGRLAGYVTSENVGELMMVRKAGAAPGSGRPGLLLPQ
jgi:stage IV sporulation protein FB